MPQLQNEPSGKECYCQVFSEGTANKEGENLSLASGPSSRPDQAPWPSVSRGLAVLKEKPFLSTPFPFSRVTRSVPSAPGRGLPLSSQGGGGGRGCGSRLLGQPGGKPQGPWQCGSGCALSAVAFPSPRSQPPQYRAFGILPSGRAEVSHGNRGCDLHMTAHSIYSPLSFPCSL